LLSLEPLWSFDPWLDDLFSLFTGVVAVPSVPPGDSTLLPVEGPFCASILSLGCPLNAESVVLAVVDIFELNENYYE
jgi:hypothetical protein